MSRTHYHVGQNTPGYLPESDVETFTNRKDAERAAAELKRYYTMDSEQAYTVEGSARAGRIDITRKDDSWDLGTVIWIDACHRDDCDDPQEPEEGDLTTEDGRTFYQDGKCVLTVPEGKNVKRAVKAFMQTAQYWPNVWSISDHGNCHLWK